MREKNKKSAIIPARGGSKRIRKKNIKNFCGRPMIGWVIEKLIDTKIFSNVIVSTDDPEIAEISKHFGAEVPFFRKKELSDDFTITVPVISNAILECEKIGYHFEYVCCVYPCSPFLTSNDLYESFHILIKGNYEFIYPITQYTHPIQRSLKFNKNNILTFYYPENELVRTQDLEVFYHDTGQFYWGKRLSWVNQKKMHTDGTGYIIPSWRVIDIDNEDDWKRAELMFSTFKQKFS